MRHAWGAAFGRLRLVVHRTHNHAGQPGRAPGRARWNPHQDLRADLVAWRIRRVQNVVVADMPDGAFADSAALPDSEGVVALAFRRGALTYLRVFVDMREHETLDAVQPPGRKTLGLQFSE